MIKIVGQVPAKSNSYTPIMTGGNPRMVKSQKLRDYEKGFILQLPPIFKGMMISTPFELEIDVYFRTRASDLDNAFKIILDCLQNAHVIKNDNLCYRIVANKYKDNKNPRIEFGLTQLDIEKKNM